MPFIRPLIAFLFAVVLVPAVATAAPGKAVDPEKIFSRKDADSDGFLSVDEYKKGMKEEQLQKADRRFKKIDTNGDGKLSLDEFKAGMPKPKE